MEKDRRQLRAEAVERLRGLRYNVDSDVLRAVLGWGHEPHFGHEAKDALIDLLDDADYSCLHDAISIIGEPCAETYADDEADAQNPRSLGADSGEYVTSEGAKVTFADCGQIADMSGNAACRVHSGAENVPETPEFAGIPQKTPGNASKVAANDTREKLEADAFKFLQDTRDDAWSGVDCQYEEVYREDMRALLDRQAAITEREVGHKLEQAESTCMGQRAEIAELNKRIVEYAEKVDELREALHKNPGVGVVEQSDYDALSKRCDKWFAAAVGAYRRFYPHDEYGIPEPEELCGMTLDAVDRLTAERDYYREQFARCLSFAIRQERGEVFDGLMAYPTPEGMVEPFQLVTDEISSLRDFHAEAEKRARELEDELADRIAEAGKLRSRER